MLRGGASGAPMELELPTQAQLSPPISARPIQASVTRPRLQLPYLDGIRGLTALYVMMSHIHIAMSFFVPDVQLGPALAAGLSDLHLPNVFGRLAVMFVDHAFGLPGVQFFIVLSGYCLMLPVVRAGG